MNPGTRLPRSLRPLPGESLAGYLLNLAFRLKLSPGEVACRVGLFTHHGYTSLNLQFAIALPPEREETFAAATGLPRESVTALTCATYEGRWFDPVSPDRTAKSHYGSLWVAPSWPHFCPRCLAQPHDKDPDRRLWQLRWTTPWALACVEHGALLAGGCPASNDHAILERDPQEFSLIRAPRHLVTHPTACRLPVPRRPEHPRDRVPLCGRHLDQAAVEAAPADVLTLQRRLDSILGGQDIALTTLGLPVSPIQYLRDLRLMAVLLQIANDTNAFVGLPASFVDATMRHLGERQQFRAGSPTHHRTWAYPPVEPHALATILTTAAALLDREDSTDAITHLVDQALAKERARWTKLRWFARPSDRLAPLLTPERTGIISTPNLRRASGGQRYSVTSDQIPAFLDTATCQREFAEFTIKDQRALRRTIPLGLVRLIEQCTATDAALALGYPPKAARSTTTRTAMDLGRDKARRLQDQIAAYADELNQHQQVNWGHRRRYFTANWLIPDQEWTVLKGLVSQHRITNKQAVLDDRRRAYSVWIWAIVTSGDPAVAPMLEPPAERPHAPGRGALQTLRKLTLPRHLSTPLHIEIVEDIAKAIAARIDATPPPP